MKRIESKRQIKKHLRWPFSRYLDFSVYTYGDEYYDKKRGLFISKCHAYYVEDGKRLHADLTFKTRVKEYQMIISWVNNEVNDDNSDTR